ncbi:MAG: hypothetical protein DMF77_09460 [Acidobacteria bacterium]|nr:MAG: hypothetical protein DMF77_09460 [Acidobacteriota bacterium]
MAAASLVLLVALDLARPYAGPGLRPWQWSAGLLAVAVLAGALRARDGGLREHWPVLVLAALLVPTYVDHTRRIEIGDPVHYYSSLRSMLFDADLRLANDYELLGWAGHEGENAQPIGAPLLWSPFVLLVHLGREAARPFGLPAPNGTEAIYAATVSLATFVYGAAGLFVLMAALRRFASPAAALWTTVLCWVGSPLRFYLSVMPAMAHGIEFAAAALTLWTYLRLREASEPARVVRAAAACGVAVGLAFLARSQDGLLLILPGLELALRVKRPADRRAMARAIAAFGGAFAVTALPQVLAWQAMFGRPFLVPHERLHGAAFMSLSHPRLLDALVDARGGLFVTHPLMLAAVAGLVLLLRRDPRYVLGAAPVLLAMWYVNASVFDWYHVRRYTGVVPLLAPGLAVLLAPLARAAVPMILIAFLALRYDLAVDGLRPLPGVAVPVRSALARVADDLAAGSYRTLEPFAPGAAVRLLAAYTGEPLLDGDATHVDLAGAAALLRLPEPARHLSEPTVEDGEAARWVTDRNARLALPIDAPGGVVLRLRARALETPDPQSMEVLWNGVSVGRRPMVPAWSEYRFDVPPEAMRRGTNVVELQFERAPIYHRVRGQGPREVRPAALGRLTLNRSP